MVNSSATTDGRHEAVDLDVNGDSTFTSRKIRLHDQGSDPELAHESIRSNKRAKTSASGSWCAGMDNGQQVVIDRTTNSSPMSLCSATMDGSHSSPEHSEHQDVPPYASLLSGSKTRATSSTSTSPSQRKPKNKTDSDNDASSFTIYEDSEDRDLQSFTLDLGMGYGLEFGLTYRYEYDLSSPGIPIPIPRSWHSYPGDDKENADEAVHENGSDAEHEADGTTDHGTWHGSDDDDEEVRTILVDDVNGRPRHDLVHDHDHGLNHRESGTAVAPSRERSQGLDGQISPTLLGAPPRRFQGRGSSRQT